MLDRNTITIPERNFIPIRLTEGEDHSLTNVDLECLVESEQVPAGRQKAITKLSREGWIVMESFEIRGCTASVCFFARWAARLPLAPASLFQRHGYSTISNYRSSLLGPWMRPDYYAQERSLVAGLLFLSFFSSFFFFIEQSLFEQRTVVKTGVEFIENLKIAANLSSSNG